jgi:hypothetical protein
MSVDDGESPELPLTEVAQVENQDTSAENNEAGHQEAEGQEQNEAASEAVAEPEQVAEAEQQDWRDKELRRKHAQIKERDREVERLRKENEDLQALAARGSSSLAAEGETEPSRAPAAPTNLTEAQVEKRARAIVEAQTYQDNLVKINDTGEKAFGKEWAKALDNLVTLGTVEMDTMQAIMATDDASKVLYELGKNPSEYQRIMDLPKARQHTEFVKLSLKETPKPKPSNAPAPTEPLAARVTPSSDLSDKDDDDTWYKKRAEQRAARRKQRVG